MKLELGHIEAGLASGADRAPQRGAPAPFLPLLVGANKL